MTKNNGVCRITYKEQRQMILDVEIKLIKTDFESSGSLNTF